MSVKCPKCGAGLEIRLEEDRQRNPSEADHLDLEQLLDSINDSELSGKVAEFVASTRERFEQYGKRTRMSDKQMAWLRRIAAGETGNDW